MEQQIDLQNSDIKENVPDTLEKAISNILKKYKSKAHLIYHIDEHLSEYSEKNYIAPITNFTGSNAVILIIQNDEIELLLYTDGRYFTQAEQELKEFKLMKIDEDDPPSVLLKERLTKTNEKISITIDMKKLGNNTYDLLKKSLPDVEFKQLSNEEFLSQIPENLLYQTRNDNDTKEGNGNKEDNDDQNYKLIDLESFKMKDIFKLDKNLKVKNYFEKMMKNLIPVHSVFEKMTAYKKNQKFLNILKESENIVSNNLPVTKLTFEQKRRIILSFIESDDKKSVFLVTDLTDIAWLLNLRSNKFYNGNFPAWMVISHDVSILFTDYEVKNRDVVLRPYDEFWPYFDSHIVTSGDISDEQSVKDINSRDLNSRDRNSGDLKSGEKDLQNSGDLNSEGKDLQNSGEKEQNENRPTVESKRIKTNQHDIFLSTKYNAYIHSKLKNKSVTNLIADLKAIKNDIEILGMLQANIIDGIALTKLFYYLKKIIINNENMPTETEFGDLIFKYRQNATEILTKDKNFITQHSFEPIVGSGIDSAIIHYRPHEKVISNEKVLLLDTGGQYIFGTTDITRTLHLGSYDFESQGTSKDNQSKRTSKDIKSKTTSKDIKLKGTLKDNQSKTTSKDDQSKTTSKDDQSKDIKSKDTLKDTPYPRDMFKKYFTLVLQGLLRSSRLTSTKKAFHKLFTDIARLPLFDYFYDYPHGTSHGVGHSNNVHENDAFNDGAQIRNVISLEPGAYFPDKFGIRIENCVVTVLKNIENDNFLTTMQLTFVPLQRDLIIKNMLDQKEKETLNEYNRNVYDFLNQYLTNEEREWLKEETAIIE